MLSCFKQDMKIQNNTNLIRFNQNFSPRFVSQPAFKGVQTLTHCNIGSMAEGVIGKVKVNKKTGEEAYLDVMKLVGASGDETYQLRTKMGHIIGEIEMRIKKAPQDYDRLEFPEDPSHVFVAYLRNYSRKGTPFHIEGLEEYKDIGTRLLQIAQRRSDEARCCGNIKLISKNESMPFYEKLGFKKEETGPWGNPNKYYLPPEAKEPLSKLCGGL